MSFNKAQRLAADTYDDGDLAHVESVADAKSCGDTLFSFLLIELSDAEGCDTLNEAARRLDRAERQLLTVRHAIERAAEREAHR